MKSYFTHGHALVIGVGDYTEPGLRNLPTTRNDALALQAILLNQDQCAYPPQQVCTLIGEEATSTAIRTALQQLAQASGPSATVIIYFSGHGGQIKNAANQTRTYLCPRDANLHDLDATAISREEFSVQLAAIQAKKVLVLLDCCYAADGVEIKSPDVGVLEWKAGLREVDVSQLTQGAGRVIIASSERDKPSFTNGHLSLFTQELVAGLGGAAQVGDHGCIGVLDLFNYLSQHVSAINADQKPILHTKDLSENFPVALYRGGQKSPEPAPATPNAPAPPAPIHTSSGTTITNNGHIRTQTINQGTPTDDLIKLMQAAQSPPKQ